MATYEEVKDVPNHPEVYLIDVRNKDELASTGAIPGSINIPLPDLGQAFEMSDNDFKTQFNRAKPSLDARLIFNCLKILNIMLCRGPNYIKIKSCKLAY